MSISLFISRFLYRIRYQLLFGSIIVTCLVAYFTQFMPKSYTVSTSIYTGIVSGSTVIDGESSSNQVVNNTFDNLINLVTAQSTLDNVSMNLLAINLINGNAKQDNEFITAKNFIELQENIPDELKRLVDKKSVKNTVANFKKLAKNSNNRFLYILLNGNNKHYSYAALQTVKIKRLSNSDMIEISYTADDPGITHSTVKLFNEELLNSYNELRYNSTNDVIAYFENEVRKLKVELNKKEDILTDYNVENNVINYADQTKFIAASFVDYEDRYEEVRRRNEGSKALLLEMEKQMDTRTKLYYTNKDFLKELDDISNINGSITEIELFTTADAQKVNKDLAEFRKELKDKEANISKLQTDMDQYKYSKEGLAIADLAQQWIVALIEHTKVNAELKVLEERRQEFTDTYARYSPVGTEIKRREREINFTENSYLSMLRALNEAYLRKKNIQLTTSNLNTISEPTFPLAPNKSKRILLIIAAFFGSLIFITVIRLLIEILDRTLRDAERTKRLIGVSPAGAFVGRSELRYRGYSKTWNRIVATSVCGRINHHLKRDGVSYVNVLSIEKGEGKSYITKFLEEDWERQGLKIKTVQIDIETVERQSYVLTSDFSCIISKEEASNYDIILVEYPPLHASSIPQALLNNAVTNIIVANAKRVWKASDNQMFNNFKEVIGNAPYMVVLNNATRYDVEDFTGELPPSKSHHSLAMRLMHMGLTSKNNSIR